MRMTFAALAALLSCAPAIAQQPAGPGGPVSPAAAPRGAAAASQAAPAPAVRPAPIYRVELVIFRATTALGSPEDWAAEAGAASPAPTDADADGGGTPAPGAPETQGPSVAAGTGDAAQPADQGAAAAPGAAATAGTSVAPVRPDIVVRELSASDLQLDGVVARLRASGRYTPVAHVGWAQSASPWGKPVEIPLQSLGVDARGLTGTVALERGQFLHLALDLRYAMDDPPAGLGASPGTVFVLDESHRVRFRERNYFDHPAFGVIALVTPDEAPRPRSSSAARPRRR